MLPARFRFAHACERALAQITRDRQGAAVRWLEVAVAHAQELDEEVVDRLLDVARAFAPRELNVLRLTQRIAEAQAAVLTHARRLNAGALSRRVAVLDLLSINLRRLGRLSEATKFASEAARLSIGVMLDSSSSTRMVVRNAVMTMLELGQFSEALPYARWSVEHAKRRDSGSAAFDLYYLGRCQFALGSFAEAETTFSEARWIRDQGRPATATREVDVVLNELDSWIVAARAAMTERAPD